MEKEIAYHALTTNLTAALKLLDEARQFAEESGRDPHDPIIDRCIGASLCLGAATAMMANMRDMAVEDGEPLTTCRVDG